MINIPSSKLVSHLQANTTSGLPSHFQGVGTDSRVDGTGKLFVALRGENFDGHNYLTQARQRGYTAALIEKQFMPKLDMLPLPAIIVENTLIAFGDMAKWYRSEFITCPVVGLTGSVGKTTTKEMIASALEEAHKTKGNLNNLIGLPLTILETDPQAPYAVFEMGTNQPGEIGRLTQIAQPTIALITSIQAVHLEGLLSLEGVAQEKGSLFENLNEHAIIIVNTDDPLIVDQTKRFKGSKQITFALNHQADIQLTSIKSIDETGSNIEIQTHNQTYHMHIPLPGKHNIANALAALACAVALEKPIESSIAGIATTELPEGRFHQKIIQQRTIIDDSYNANPSSMKAAISTILAIANKGSIFLCLGNMAELGDTSIQLHQELGSWIANNVSGTLLTTGEYAQSMSNQASSSSLTVEHFENHQEIAAYLAKQSQPGDYILIKGSRSSQMEKVITNLQAIWAEPHS